MLDNDILIKNLRLLAYAVRLEEPGAIADYADAARWVEDNFGLEGQVTELSQRTGRENSDANVPDTLVNAGPDRAGEGTKISDSSYMPHLGIWGFSGHAIRNWQRRAEALKLTYSTSKMGSDVYAVDEEEVLKMAEIIKERRRLSEATDRIKAGKPLAETVLHPGTDAHDSTKDYGRSPYKNWSDVEQSQSSICLSISSGTRYVNGSMSQHQNWVSIEIRSPDGRTLVEVAMSPDQFASFLIGRTLIPCTLDHYWSMGTGSIALRERVYSPESVLERMHQRLNDAIKEQDKDFLGIIEKLVTQAGKPLSKSKLDELIKELKWVAGKRGDSAGFIVEQAVEEGSALAESALMRVLLAGQTGGDPKATIAGLAQSFKSGLIAHKP